MSYILDALQKSQKERTRLGAPQGSGGPRAAWRSAKRSARWSTAAFVLAFSALLVTLYGRIFPLGEDSSGLAEKARESGAQVANISAPQATGNSREDPVVAGDRGQNAPVLGRDSAGSGTRSSTADARPNAKPPLPEARPTTSRPDPREDPADRISASAQPRPAGERSDAPAKGLREEDIVLRDTLLRLARQPAVSPPEKRAGGVVEQPGGQTAGEAETGELPPGASALPAGVFAELPERRIMVHVYRPDPDRRFVVVNSQKLREGEKSSEGLTVDRILPSGVVFVFRGHRFFASR